MVTVVLPAYNEGKGIRVLLDEIDATMKEAMTEYRAVVVDDGSADDTADRVKEAGRDRPIALVEHGENRGLAEAVRTGLLASLRDAQPGDVIVTMDADSTHPPALIQRMVRSIREGCDVVIASRYRPGARVVGVPLLRRILSYGASLLFRLVFPVPGVKDYTCGYRAYRASCLQQAFDRYGDAFISTTGFTCMADILLRLRTMDLVMGEVPLLLRYDLKDGASKMDIGRTIRDTLALMWRRKLGK
jgi:dolichol-phosphate mannosyltransferase